MNMDWFTSSLCQDFEYNNTISLNTTKETFDEANHSTVLEDLDIKPFICDTISHEHGNLFNQPHAAENRTDYNGIDDDVNVLCNLDDGSMPNNGVLSSTKDDGDETVNSGNAGIIHRGPGINGSPGIGSNALCNGFNNDAIVADSTDELLYDSRKREQKRRPKPKDGSQLLCLICGDRALGYNFDAITCESCKAFFRRNALKTKVFTCSFEGNCKLDPHTRKFCSGCRLKKCFEAGMRKQWILTDDQLAKRRRKGNGQGRLDSYDTTMEESPPMTETGNQLPPQLPPVSQLQPLPVASQATKLEMYSPPSSCDEVTTNYMSDEMDNSSPGVFTSFSPPVIKMEPDKDDFPRPLSDEIAKEIAKLEDEYHQVFDMYSDEQAKRVTEKPHNANDLFNMTDLFIRRLIKFTKHIPEFKQLKQDDQIHLLKGGIMEIMVLRSAMGFDMQNFQWKVKQAKDKEAREIDPRIIQEQLGTMVYKDHLQFLTSLHQLTNSNKTIMTLLFVIELFSSDRPNVNNKAAVSGAQEKFSMWLKAYLQSIMSVNDAKQLYPKLLMKLLDVRNLGESSAKLASHLDITKLEPLLIEIFSLQK